MKIRHLAHCFIEGAEGQPGTVADVDDKVAEALIERRAAYPYSAEHDTPAGLAAAACGPNAFAGYLKRITQPTAPVAPGVPAIPGAPAGALEGGKASGKGK